MRDRLFFIALILALYILVFASPVSANVDETQKKAIIIIMDYMDLDTLIEADTPNIDFISEKGSTSLMNIRAGNRYHSSPYMSLAVSSRVLAPVNSNYAYDYEEKVYKLPFIFQEYDSLFTAGEIFQNFTGKKAPQDSVVHLYAKSIQRFSAQSKHTYEMGHLGKTAHDLSLSVGVIGNSDTIDSLNRSVVLLAMNEQGIVKHGKVDHTLLEVDPKSLAGVKSNHVAYMDSFRDLLPRTDIIFIDMGDTARVEFSQNQASDEQFLLHKLKAIEDNDELLGLILKEIDISDTMLAIISPNPSKNAIDQGNFGLTQFILYDPNLEAGLLSSASTRRAGLVSNLDFLPSLFNFFDHSVPAKGAVMLSTKSDQGLENLNQQLNHFIQLRSSRNTIHSIFIFFSVLMLISGYLFYIQKKNFLQPYIQLILTIPLCIPLVILFLSFTGYYNIYLTILIMIMASILSAFLLSILFKDPWQRLGYICGLTAILICVDIFLGAPLMLASGLGSDTIAGGRYYGMGNDYMGILLASSLLFLMLTLWQSKSKISKAIRIAFTVAFMIVVTLAIGHPKYGANVGGLISSLITSGALIFILLDEKINLKRIIIIFSVAIAGVIAIAKLDAMYNPSPSHAGRAIDNLLSNGFSFFFATLQTKIGILLNTIINSPWSFVFLLAILALIISIRQNKKLLSLINDKTASTPKILQILLIASISVFLVNDTGIIASTLITLYFMIVFYLTIDSQKPSVRGQ